MIEGRVLAHQSLHPAHSRRAVAAFDVELAIDWELAVVTGRTQVPRAQEFHLTQHREKSALLQLMSNPSIAIGRRLQRDPLHLIAQFHLHWRGLARHASAVETSPAHAGHLAERVHDLPFRRALLDFVDRKLCSIRALANEMNRLRGELRLPPTTM